MAMRGLYGARLTSHQSRVTPKPPNSRMQVDMYQNSTNIPNLGFEVLHSSRVCPRRHHPLTSHHLILEKRQGNNLHHESISVHCVETRACLYHSRGTEGWRCLIECSNNDSDDNIDKQHRISVVRCFTSVGCSL